MPDLNLCIKNRRKNLSKIWRSKEWKEARAIFLSFHPDKKCARCGRVGTIVPGHSSEDYNDMETYIQKVKDNECPPLCPTCNLMEMKGRKPCPSCIEKFHKGESDRIRYITQDQETCYVCSPGYDPEILTAISPRKIYFPVLCNIITSVSSVLIAYYFLG